MPIEKKQHSIIYRFVNFFGSEKKFINFCNKKKNLLLTFVAIMFKLFVVKVPLQRNVVSTFFEKFSIFRQSSNARITFGPFTA